MPSAESRHIAFFLKAMGGGGAERAFATLAAGFARRGHRVDLVLSSKRGPMLRHVEPPIRVVDLGDPSAPRGLPALLRLSGGVRRVAAPVLLQRRPKVVGSLAALGRYLRAEQPDALLSTFGYNALVALWARHLASVPTKVLVREANVLSQEVSQTRRPYLRMLPRLIHEWYPRADAIISVTRGVGDDLALTANIPRERIRTIYNGVETDRIERLAAAPVEHPWFVGRAVPVVLAVGRLKPQKDYPNLLRAFARLRKRRELRLVVLGEGKDRVRLEQLSRDLDIHRDVSFMGFVSNPYAFRVRAAVLALSSAWEGIANVLIEAMACGCPVVSTDCPAGPAEVLDGGAYGRLVPVGDDRALAGAIELVLDAPPEPAWLRKRANEFSLDRAVDEYLDALFVAEA